MKEKRPWGWYNVIDHGDRYKVKSIEVQPDQKLSLQKHFHRAEHWVVVEGTALVEVDGKESIVSENQSAIYQQILCIDYLILVRYHLEL